MPVNQCVILTALSQTKGINLITYYAAVIYSGLNLSGFLSRLLAALNGTEYFIASWPAVYLVERVGRRKLMLFGAAGQAATMAALAGAASLTGGGNPPKGPSIAVIALLFVFNTFFAVGWLGMTWLYPAEIVPLKIRAPANALSTVSTYLIPACCLYFSLRDSMKRFLACWDCS